MMGSITPGIWRGCAPSTLLLAFTAALIIAGPRAGYAAQAIIRSPADAATLDKTLDQISAHYRETHSFTADFTEKITSPGAADRTRSGKVYYRKPGRMRWEFAAPEQETIVADGKAVYSYEPDLNQVIETPVAGLIKSPSATAFLLGFGDLRADFDVSALSHPPADGLIYLVLKPKGGGNPAIAGIDPTNWNLSKLVFQDVAGDSTSLAFSNFKINQELPDSLFQFSVPNGADVVSTPQS
jgi:outer membrane lipoprotein carrier protein